MTNCGGVSSCSLSDSRGWLWWQNINEQCADCFFLMWLLRVPQGFRGTVSPAQHECNSDTENNNNIKKVRGKHVYKNLIKLSSHSKTNLIISPNINQLLCKQCEYNLHLDNYFSWLVAPLGLIYTLLPRSSSSLKLYVVYTEVNIQSRDSVLRSFRWKLCFASLKVVIINIFMNVWTDNVLRVSGPRQAAVIHLKKTLKTDCMLRGQHQTELVTSWWVQWSI